MNVVIKVDEETKKKMIQYYKDKTREKTEVIAEKLTFLSSKKRDDE